MNWICKVSLCNRHTNSRYKNQEKSWDWLKDRNRNPVRTTETAEEYPKLPKAERDALKDQGGFVGGWLREGIRKNGNVICRTVGALDADNIPGDVNFPALVRVKLAGFEWFLYSTHKHTPEAPRFRLVILFDREVSEDEYPALMRKIAYDLGMDYFDDSTYQANRMMYWSSCPSNGEFVFDEAEGQPLPVDKYLGRYENWRDTSQWPTSSRESEVVQKSASAQEDPLNKEGVVGVFCRTFFPIQTALEKFLPDVYAPTDRDGRWDYLKADSTAGVVIYDDRFVYSHHTTDPACGKLLNAFDIVRIHKFGNDETKKSFMQMATFAVEQEEVKLRLDQERKESVAQDFEPYVAGDFVGASDWKSKLRCRPRSSELENSAWNLMLIFANDPDFQHFAFNEMAGKIQVTGDLPWERPEGNKFWRDADTAQLKVLLDNRYTVFSDRVLDACFTKTAEDRHFHPVRDYLSALPPWDGENRIEFLFQRCLQAEDTPYTRAVARKVFAGAVARIFKPGVKFDSIPVLDGAQGIGKSSLFRELCGADYYSETLSLTDMSDKSGAEKLQGFWIVEIGELAGMRKADIEKVKAFLSTTDDAYRPSYGRVVESHPRQCIIVATVNGDRGYLRDTTGNRRFWVIKCAQTEQVKHFAFTPAERDQIWAEAVHLWENGEKLFLEDDLVGTAEEIARGAMEEDDRQGMVEAYLDLLLPLSWPDMDLYARRNWLSDLGDPTRKAGMVRRETVSCVEIWAECFGNDPMSIKKTDSYELSAILARVPGWERTGKRQYIPLYGRQRIYIRVPDELSEGDNGTPGTASSPEYASSDLIPVEAQDIGTAVLSNSGAPSLSSEAAGDSGTAVQETFFDFLS